jgi:hydrogenase maturation protease
VSGTAVIGLGNPLMGDDGFGLAALAILRDEWTLEGVELADGGTWGLSLLPILEDAQRVILIDAIAAGAQPGEIVVLERERLPIYLTRKLSPHQVDMRDVLALAEWRGTLPAETVAIGVQPREVELGVALSPDAVNALRPVVAAVVERLKRWGHACERVGDAAPCTR